MLNRYSVPRANKQGHRPDELFSASVLARNKSRLLQETRLSPAPVLHKGPEQEGGLGRGRDGGRFCWTTDSPNQGHREEKEMRPEPEVRADDPGRVQVFVATWLAQRVSGQGTGGAADDEAGSM